MKIPKEIDELFEIFEENGEEIFLVGGFVRDLLRAQHSDELWTMAKKHQANYGGTGDFSVFPDEESRLWAQLDMGQKDADFATSARPEKTIEILKKAGLKTIPIGIEFGTIQTILKKKLVSVKTEKGKIVKKENVYNEFKVEITTFRSHESYTKGSRKPAVKFGDNIKDDLARRDFTINAIAMDRQMRTYDPFFGEGDLTQGVFWTPLDAETSFGDDPLRMLRACRFFARDVAGPSWEVAKGMEAMKKEIHTVSKERIFEETTKILVAKRPDLGLKLLVDSGLLNEVFPELQAVVEFKTQQKSKALWAHVVQVVGQTPPDPVLRWAALFHDVGKPPVVREFRKEVTFHGHEVAGAEIWDQVADRLKVSNEFKERVSMVIRESDSLVELKKSGVTDKALRRFIRRAGPHLDNIFQFTMADMTSKWPKKLATMKRKTKAVKKRIDKIIKDDNVAELKLPKNTGTLLMQSLNIKGGRLLGEIMKCLTQKLIDGELKLGDDFVSEGEVILSEFRQKKRVC